MERYFWNNVSDDLRVARDVHEVLTFNMEGYVEVNEDKYGELCHERQVAEEMREYDQMLFPNDDPEEVIG